MEQTQSATLERKEDAGEGPAGIVTRWNLEWQQASEAEKTWRKKAKDVIETYRDEKDRSNSQFNILWANTELLRPALYNSTPKPDVRRRFRDADPVGKEVAEVIERALSFCIDSYDFDHVMSAAVLDELLPGRAVTRVKFEPSFVSKTGPDEKLYDELSYAEVMCEQVDWDCFRRGPGRNWKQVQWVGFEHRLTRDEFDKRFPEFAGRATLDYDVSDSEEKQKDAHPEVFKRTIVREIWDKEKRQVIFIAPSIKEKPVLVQDDPLNLVDFFPIPRPLYAIDSTTTLVPIEEYRLYKDQAEELNRITARINKLTAGLKLRGIYDATIAEMPQVMEQSDNGLVPCTESQIAMQYGGFDKAIWMLPIEQAASVLQQLYQNRDQIKQVIYEITGISDVLRGATDPNETLGAQQLKAQTGSQRLQRRQREVQRYVRDLLRLKAEIIAEKFTPQILTMMTGIPVTVEMQKVMRQDLSRSFRIDIETDSTIAADQQADRESITQLITGIGEYVNNMGPAVESGAIPKEAAKKILLSSIRRFRLGRDVEDALEQAEMQPEQAQQPGVDPAMAEAQAQTQLEQQQLAVDADAKAAELEEKRQQRITDNDFRERELALKERDMMLREQESAARIANERMKSESESATVKADNEIKLQPVRERQEDLTKIAAGLQALAEAMIQGQQQNQAQMQQLMSIVAAPKVGFKDAQGRFHVQPELANI